MCRAQCVLVMALFFGLVHSWDIAISTEDRIEFYNNIGHKMDTVRLNSRNLAALAYNEVDNMLLFVDKQSNNDAICGYNLISSSQNCYIERHGGNIHGLAFDPVTNTLFFTDTEERSINWYSFDPTFTNNADGNLLMKIDEGIPTDIVVDSCRGYVYWINTDVTPSTIERARFDGSDREVIITATHEFNLNSLAIDQQEQKIYWKMLVSESSDYIYKADLNGKNREVIMDQMYYSGDHLNAFSVTKQSLLTVSSCTSCFFRYIYQISKPFDGYSFDNLFEVASSGLVGIVTNYKVKDQIQGISDCKRVFDKDILKTVNREQVASFCVHGVKEIGQSLCKCSPGYIGERCDVTVCENFCFQGSCNITEDGGPKCRCNAGYTGERCEVNVCSGYCLNNGTCSLDDDSKPVCLCKGDYLGNRCEVSVCESYCWQGNCSFNEEGLPECRCNVGYTGERCEVNVCSGYCLNNGACVLNEEDEPFCDCIGEYEGQRCEVPASVNDNDGPLIEKTVAASQTPGSRSKDDQNNAISSAFKHYTAERNITLADLLANWQKPVATISVVVEVKTNN